MARIVIFSDAHGRRKYLDRMLKYYGTADYFIFCGDGLSEVLDVFAGELINKLIYVEGNCDYVQQSIRVDKIAGMRFFISHGNQYHVKSGIFSLTLKAQELGADIVCFGHTHMPYMERIDGILYINPGALYSGELAIMDIENGRVDAVHVNVAD